jgi:hypothetical protein
LPSIHVQYVCKSEAEQIRCHPKYRFHNTRTMVGTHRRTNRMSPAEANHMSKLLEDFKIM